MTITLQDAWSDWIGPAVSVKRFGAVGDGVVDDTTAIQAAVDSGEGRIGFPVGTFKTTSSISLATTSAADVEICGQGRGSYILGNFADYIFKRPAGSAIQTARHLSSMRIRNTHAAGGGVLLTGTSGSTIRKCEVQAFLAIGAFENNFTTEITSCKIIWSAYTAGSIGVMMGAHCNVISCDIVGFENAIRAKGPTNNIIGCRMEVNKVAIRLGRDETDADYSCTRSIIAGNSMEANDTAIYAQHIGNCLIAGNAGLGSASAPSGESIYGLRIGAGAASYCTFDSNGFNGNYDTAAVAVDANPTNCVMMSTLASNGGSGVAWSLPADYSGLTIIKSNNPAAGVIKLASFTVAALPTAAEAMAGGIAFVTDATATTPRSTVAGGGANKVAVMSNGTNWLIVA